jgi:hypothetical protein
MKGITISRSWRFIKPTTTGGRPNMLVNPNNCLVKKVLMRMVESGDYFFFAFDKHVTLHRLLLAPHRSFVATAPHRLAAHLIR